MRCSLVRLSTPTSPSAPGLPLVGAHSLQAERLTSRVGSISPTSSDTKRDFYSALPFDGAAAVVCAACIGLAGWVCYRFFVSYHLPSKKSAQETGAQIESAFADLPRCLLLALRGLGEMSDLSPQGEPKMW